MRIRFHMASRLHGGECHILCAAALAAVVLGIFFRTLFRGQQAHDIPACFDGSHPQPDLQIFTLFQLGFDRGEIRLSFSVSALQFALRNLDIGFSLDTGFSEIELNIFQLGDLVGCGVPISFSCFKRCRIRWPVPLCIIPFP